MRRIIWSPSAALYLEEVYAYIALDNEQAAAATVARIHLAVERARRFPGTGRPTRWPKYRQMVVTPYIVTYRIAGTALHILDVRHGAQRTYSPITGKPLRRLQ